jgi:hypothetical protein
MEGPRVLTANGVAAALERAWAAALPGREAAERNAVLRAAQRPQTLLRLKTSGAQCGFL